MSVVHLYCSRIAIDFSCVAIVLAEITFQLQSSSKRPEKKNNNHGTGRAGLNTTVDWIKTTKLQMEEKSSGEQELKVVTKRRS
jgi:hypothetical protein